VVPAAAARDDGATVESFQRAEGQAFDYLAAADPRLAKRARVRASDEVLKRIGMAAVLREDASAAIVGGSLDLFAFRARGQALEAAAKIVAEGARGPLPDSSAPLSKLARPRLERELLARLIEEERARVDDEQRLGEASGALVRGMVETWAPPAVPQEWPERDAWAAKHLLAIRDSLHDRSARTGPSDLDVSLYPLERILAPMQFPKAAAALAEVRIAIDEDERTVPKVERGELLIHQLQYHLGVQPSLDAVRARIAELEPRLRQAAEKSLEAAGTPRVDVETRARAMLLAEGACAPIEGSAVRSMSPPPERAAICRIVRALQEGTRDPVALFAAHDDTILALAALDGSITRHDAMISHPPPEEADTLERAARERPVAALGVALALDLVWSSPSPEAALTHWRALGEAPLDIVSRELSHPSP
jgi:hypothetical protein